MNAVDKALSWITKNYGIVFVIGVSFITIGLVIFGLYSSSDTDTSIYRTIRAYKHLPNGNTEVYYKGGGLEIEGTWFFNLDSNYEFYRDENSTVWKVDPY